MMIESAKRTFSNKLNVTVNTYFLSMCFVTFVYETCFNDIYTEIHATLNFAETYIRFKFERITRDTETTRLLAPAAAVE
jgi:hypothetical protein